MNTDQTYCGLTWSQINAAQQGRWELGHIDLTKPAKRPASPSDLALLEKHGEQRLRELEMFGVLDRLNLPLFAP